MFAAPDEMKALLIGYPFEIFIAIFMPEKKFRDKTRLPTNEDWKVRSGNLPQKSDTSFHDAIVSQF